MMIKVGDSIGMIVKASRDGKSFWKLHEGKVMSITTNTRGVRVKATGFYTLDDDAVEDIEDSTSWMQENPALILVREMFVLTVELRERVERWIRENNARDDGGDGDENP